ncbi:uncharacterized protein TM35_000242140 [Trypanosoma theileri]|uniref:Uncharacterized protein n=1 Tax=Trypanosoma theileri TaxID=67003 RepID=A0A1X0NQU1_9TRYP|nr:uncharacterized protein TM35_000242140 [Trypanosoma theileri]ORC87064.1 hypothetical protein TM35_000242140 [Trypanosoma theileri]
MLHFAAGAIFSLSCFAFVDGCITAKQIGVPFNFLMWLPSIMIFCGMFVLSFVDAKVIADVDYSFEDSNTQRAKIFFFIAALLMLGGLAVALWKAIEPYSQVNNSWPGVSLVIQGVLLMVCSGIFFYARLKNEGDEI